jgi:NAD(P)-dependent dehydrogenase (short-subunit alcohol dehydrogenase family)
LSGKDKTPLITGACGGIGRALVQVFHGGGYRVIATDLADEKPNIPCTHYHSGDLGRFDTDETNAA